MREINDDLYHNSSLETTPIEDYMAENDGFEEVGGMPDAGLDGSEESQGPNETANESESGDES